MISGSLEHFLSQHVSRSVLLRVPLDHFVITRTRNARDCEFRVQGKSVATLQTNVLNDALEAKYIDLFKRTSLVDTYKFLPIHVLHTGVGTYIGTFTSRDIALLVATALYESGVFTTLKVNTEQDLSFPCHTAETTLLNLSVVAVGCHSLYLPDVIRWCANNDYRRYP